MQTTLHLLLGITILSWAKLSSTEPGAEDLVTNVLNKVLWSPQPTPKPTPKPATKPDKPHSGSLAPSFRFTVTEDEIWKLSLVENIVTAYPPPDTKVTQTGGWSNDVFGLWKWQLCWKTSGFEVLLELIVSFLNKKYSPEDVFNHRDGMSQIHIPIYTGSDKPNPSFDSCQKGIENLIDSRGSISIPNVELVAWNKGFSDSDMKYEYWYSLFYDEDTDQYYNCSTTTKFPLVPDKNYINKFQLKQFLSLFRDESGNIIQDNMPPEGERWSDILFGKGALVFQ